MTMLVSTNLFFDRTNRQLGGLTADVQKLQTQLATGKRINTASDDASAFRRVQRLEVAGADDAAWRNNVTLASSVLEQADTTLGNVTNLLQRAQELAVQSNSGTLSDSDRRVVAAQLRGVVEDLVSLANTRDGRGTPLFGAASGDTAVTRDASGNLIFAGTGDPPSIPVGDDTAVRPSESAERIFGGLTAAGGGSTDIFAELTNLAAALEAPGGTTVPSVAATTLDQLKATVEQVSAVRGSIGARAARLDLEKSRLEDAAVTREVDRSDLEGADIQATIVQLQKTSTILQATQMSLSRLSQLSLFDYLR